MDEEFLSLICMADGVALSKDAGENDNKILSDLLSECDTDRNIFNAAVSCKRIKPAVRDGLDIDLLIKRGVFTAQKKNGFTFLKGKINGRDCLFAKCGIGKVNAARCTQTIIDCFPVSRIINYGSSGSLASDAVYGDIVIGSECAQWDFDLTVFGHPEGFIPSTGRFFKSSPELIELCRELSHISEYFGFKCRTGRIVSGDSFVSSDERKFHLRDEFGALCTDMESASVSMVCSFSNIPCLCLRAMSDGASEKAGSEEFYSNLNLASDNCAVFIYMIISCL